MFKKIHRRANAVTLAAALALSPVAYVGTTKKADAMIVAFIVATPTIWAVRVLLSPRKAY